MKSSMVHWIPTLILCVVSCCMLPGAIHAYELYTVGEFGSSYRYDGSEWHAITDNGYDYNEVWAFSETNIYAVTSNGQVRHYDGMTWTTVYHHAGDPAFSDIWAASPSDIFVSFADYGYVLYFDGIEWTQTSLPDVSDIYSIWGTSATNVYAACREGCYRYDGMSWSEVSLPATYDGYRWSSVWCGGESDVYLASGSVDMVILHYDGLEWSSMSLPSGVMYDYMHDMWGIPGDFVYAVGEYGTILHYSYSQGEWSNVSIPGVYTDYTSVSGNAENDFYVSGDETIHHFKGSQWESFAVEFVPRDIYALSNDVVFIAGDNGSFGLYDRDDWSRWTPEIIEDFTDVWASFAGNVCVVGDEGGIYILEQESWIEVARPTDRLLAIWGSSDNDIYAAGNGVYHYGGSGWDQISEAYVTDVWGLSGTNIYFCGDNKIYQFDGAEIDTIHVFSEPDLQLLGIWAHDESNLYAAGYSWYDDPYWGYVYTKIVYYYNGSEWATPISNSFPGYCQFNAIWGIAADTVFTAGGDPDYYRDAYGWHVLPTPFYGTDLWGATHDDIYFSTFQYGVMHYDGADFECVLPTGAVLNSVWGVEEELTPAEMPAAVSFLAQNHPNPFNPMTTISFSLRERGRASLAIYDVAGRLVRVLVDGVIDVGPQEVTWDGRNGYGGAVASGIYFYRLEAGAYVETKKMVLLR